MKIGPKSTQRISNFVLWYLREELPIEQGKVKM